MKSNTYHTCTIFEFSPEISETYLYIRINVFEVYSHGMHFVTSIFPIAISFLPTSQFHKGMQFAKSQKDTLQWLLRQRERSYSVILGCIPRVKIHTSFTISISTSNVYLNIWSSVLSRKKTKFFEWNKNVHSKTHMCMVWGKWKNLWKIIWKSAAYCIKAA